ncbi:MAG: hypothetical protein MJZ81_07840 [Bacteroidales bacterium]|nr:hypothetical protein [Bacteroidales bacterium]
MSETANNLIESLQIAEGHFYGAAEGGWRYRSVFCPDDDMMPYEHLEIVGDLEDKAYNAGNKDDHNTAKMTMSHDEINVINLALTMYKSILMQVHK